MLTSVAHETVARWFFLVVGGAILFFFWKIIEPFAIVLLTAAVIAILCTPLERRLRKFFRGRAHLSAAVVTLLVILIVLGPLSAIAIVMVQQADGVIRGTLADPAWRAGFHLLDLPVLQFLPTSLRDYLGSIDLAVIAGALAGFAQEKIGPFLSGAADFIYKTFIFFICLYFFLLERERITKEALALSPFKDSVDRSIVIRLVETVRGVVFGSLIVALAQGTIAAIGLTLFGVPAPLIWAALVVIAAQIPMLGTAAIMLPAVLYLALIGDTPAAIGLLIWSMLAVGLIDNVLQPYIVGGKTRMHALLILLAMLGGLQYFGAVGFIVGPTILAAVLVVLELYKAGILEKRNVA